MSQVASQNDLESLLKEYFEGMDTRRKKEIESVLHSWKSAPESLSVAQTCLTHQDASSAYMKWFCLSVFESWIDKMPPGDRTSLRQFLWAQLVKNASSIAPPKFVQTKHIKLVVDIAKREYPERWPDFWTDMSSLASSASARLCLEVVKVVCEEFCPSNLSSSTHRLDLDMKQRVLLKEACTLQLDGILNLLASVFNSTYLTYLEKRSKNLNTNLKNGTATPTTFGFPSPVKSSEFSSPLGAAGLLGESPSQPHLLSSSPSTSSSSGYIPATPTSNLSSTPSKSHGPSPQKQYPCLDNESIENCHLALEILQHILSWAPLSQLNQLIPALDAAFQFIQCHQDEAILELAILSVSCANEVLARKYTPPHIEPFLLLFAKHICDLLQNMCEPLQSSSSQQPEQQIGFPSHSCIGIESDDTTFHTKFMDLLTHFVSQHIRRMDQVSDFPMMHFLRLLFTFTLNQTHPRIFSTSVHIWDTFVESVLSQCSFSELIDSGNGLSVSKGELYRKKYQDGLVQLAVQMLAKVSFRGNSEALFLMGAHDLSTRQEDQGGGEHSQHHLDDDHIDGDDGMDTSRGSYESVVKPAALLVGKIVDLYPEVLMESLFHTLADAIRVVKEYVSGSSWSGTTMQCAMDIITLCTIFSRVSHQFTNSFNEHFQATFTFYNLLADALEVLLTIHRGGTPLASKQDPQQHVILSKVCSALFGTLSVFVHWLKLFRESISEMNETNPEWVSFHALVHRMISLSFSAISSSTVSTSSASIPNSSIRSDHHDTMTVSLAASQWLLSYTQTTRPQLQESSLLQEGVFKIHGWSLGHDFPVRHNLYLFATSLLALGASSSQARKETTEDWKSREDVFTAFIKPIVTDYLGLLSNSTNPLTPEAERQIIVILKNLHSCIQVVSQQPTSCRKVVFGGIQSTFVPTLQLMIIHKQPRSLADEVVSQVLQFLHISITTFQRLLPAPETIQSLQQILTFLDEEITSNVLKQRPQGPDILERALRLLISIVEDPSKTFDPLQDSFCHICISSLYPHFFSSDNQPAFLHVRPFFYTLVSGVIQKMWRSVFGAASVTVNGKDGDASVNDPERMKRILSLFEMMVMGLKWGHPETTRHLLTQFDHLDAKFRLFNKPFFVSHVYFPLMQDLLDSLFSRRTDLLREEMISLIGKMIAHEESVFVSQVIPWFMSQRCQNLPQQHAEVLWNYMNRIKDVPTAQEYLPLLVNDYGYYCHLLSL